MTEIKICGLTCKEDIDIINEFPITYAGFVLYVPKSKRNLTLEQAQQLKAGLKESVKTVAVTVSPTKEQVELIQEAGFDVIQIHGSLHREVEQYVKIPVFRAVNVETEEDIQKVMKEASNKISYFVFDGRTPGGGETFDWGMLKKMVDNTTKIMLAGGLTDKNVGEAIRLLHPGIVDVSSGVEKETGKGKDKEKIARFVKAVFNR
ncbi:MAG TPA: phosphoribosylanthranilate isomerase [Lachnospiraceae bacterium]|nr:phosphoribosylanthranilate isomerase [Lachnospiraceae bacterium]